MVIITFAKDSYMVDIVKGRKTTTIRRNWERWLQVFEAGHNLHVYRGSRFSPDRQYVGECEIKEVVIKRGSQFTDEDARADGFDNVYDLFLALLEHNPKMTYNVARDRKWAIIVFGEWVDGPTFTER